MAIYEIEIANDTNSPHLFAPIKEKVRGRWDFTKIHRDRGGPAQAITKVTSVIPGQRLRLDTSKRTASRIETLSSTAEGRELWERLKPVCAANAQFFSNASGRAFNELQKDLHFKDIDDDTIKNWMHWMRRAIDSRQAQYVPGSQDLPTVAFIKDRVPGKRMKEPWSNRAPADDKEREKMYTDNVPSSGKPHKAGDEEMAGAGAGSSQGGTQSGNQGGGGQGSRGGGQGGKQK